MVQLIEECLHLATGLPNASARLPPRHGVDDWASSVRSSEVDDRRVRHADLLRQFRYRSAEFILPPPFSRSIRQVLRNCNGNGSGRDDRKLILIGFRVIQHHQNDIKRGTGLMEDDRTTLNPLAGDLSESSHGRRVFGDRRGTESSYPRLRRAVYLRPDTWNRTRRRSSTRRCFVDQASPTRCVKFKENHRPSVTPPGTQSTRGWPIVLAFLSQVPTMRQGMVPIEGLIRPRRRTSTAA